MTAGPAARGAAVGGAAVGGAAVGGADDPGEDRTAAIRAAARRLAAADEAAPRPARDPVNLPMIRNWLEALGDTDPRYEADGVAPPAMIQVWTMRGLRPAVDPGDPLAAMSAVLDDAGFTSVVATNSEQTYHRPVRLGEQLAVRSRLVDVTGPKRTSLGEGWFVTTRSTWYAGTEAVAAMLFRVLKFRPPAAPAPTVAAPAARTAPATPPVVPAPATVLRPVISRDTAFFWAGTAVGQLRVQRCGGCGAVRHPPGPACPRCGALRPEYLVASGRGRVFSYVVHHHPPVPGRRLPIVVALVELPEGVRMVGELLDAAPDEVRIDAPVRVEFVRVDDDLTLPAWRLDPPDQPPPDAPALRPEASVLPPDAAVLPPDAAVLPPDAAALGPEASALPPDAAVLPPLAIDLTPTFVISTAIATRDFQDVHHDRDRAVRRGSKDIFLNILTTTGLVQRYVTAWAGPGAVIHRIAIRLGAPGYAGDRLTLTGRVADEADGECRVEVVGRTSLGDHVTGTVDLRLPGGPS